MNPPATLLLIDTNVWLDYFLAWRPGHKGACELVRFAAEHDLTLLYAAISLKDVYYLVAAITKRAVRDAGGTLTEGDAAVAGEIAWCCVENMRELGDAVGLDESDLWLAAKYRTIHGDLEDNLVLAAAERAHVAHLVTNDEALAKHAPVSALSPHDMLKLLEITR